MKSYGITCCHELICQDQVMNDRIKCWKFGSAKLTVLQLRRYGNIYTTYPHFKNDTLLNANNCEGKLNISWKDQSAKCSNISWSYCMLSDSPWIKKKKSIMTSNWALLQTSYICMHMNLICHPIKPRKGARIWLMAIFPTKTIAFFHGDNFGPIIKYQDIISEMLPAT